MLRACIALVLDAMQRLGCLPAKHIDATVDGPVVTCLLFATEACCVQNGGNNE